MENIGIKLTRLSDNETIEVAFKFGSILVGRNAEVCTFVLEDKHVARLHARFDYEDGVLKLYDINQKNGTYVNSEKLAEGVPAFINVGDIITFAGIDSYKFEGFIEGEAPVEEPVFEAPAEEAPVYEAPAFEAPVYEAAPVAEDAPAYEAPSYEAPAYAQTPADTYPNMPENNAYAANDEIYDAPAYFGGAENQASEYAPAEAPVADENQFAPQQDFAQPAEPQPFVAPEQPFVAPEQPFAQPVAEPFAAPQQPQEFVPQPFEPLSYDDQQQGFDPQAFYSQPQQNFEQQPFYNQPQQNFEPQQFAPQAPYDQQYYPQNQPAGNEWNPNNDNGFNNGMPNYFDNNNNK